jgi:hypothetical protein
MGKSNLQTLNFKWKPNKLQIVEFKWKMHCWKENDMKTLELANPKLEAKI